jgi:CHRD domain
VMLALAGVALADHPGGGGTPFFATLTPEAECNAAGVCNLGQPGASGETELRLNSGQEEICYTTTAEGLTHPLTGAHIHRAPAGVAGPIVVPFPTEQGVGSACVFAPRELIKEIRQNPEAFYVNVHTTAFRAGAIRGQLCGPGRGNCR